MKANTPIVSIVTVGMNHLPYIKSLLLSLYVDNIPNIDYEMIYVDNCSSDGSVEFIKKNYPQVIIHVNQKVKGFGENNNFGALHANGEYIAIINPDIVLLKESIDNLYKYMKTHSKIGILVPKLLNPDLTIQHSVRKFINIKLLFWRIISRGNDNSNNRYVQEYILKDMNYEDTQVIDWAIGAAMFLRKSTFNTLKGFDEDYFLYMEDEDLCIRSWKIGKPVVYYPKSSMIHNHLRESNKINKKAYLHIKSMFTFFRKHGIFINQKS